MWDRYDPRSDDRDRGLSRNRSFGSRRASNERHRNEDHEPRDVFTRDRLERQDYPRLLFGDGATKAVRDFPDKLPIGVPPSIEPHVFAYLVTGPSPMDFRLFLLRHTALLRVSSDGPSDIANSA